eukprot:TRINITY_DN46530_c0_g1_i1.p1 TRINITY_DN46530_c0_g1~~TRINITY_DN46530_c0_g1_i1.p1  ORF type:complete len:213 (+),score=45.67 TRINITY_DN46530_c0_g1_i1:268-906(+)
MDKEVVEGQETPKEAADTTKEATVMTRDEEALLLASCEKDLATACALSAAAEAALDQLGKRDFPECKSFRLPPRCVISVLECLIHLRTGLDDSIELRKNGRAKDLSFMQAQRMVNNPGNFVYGLRSFKSEIDEGSVPQANVDAAKSIITQMGDDFSADAIRRNAKGSEWASLAAALAEWMAKMISYYDVLELAQKKKELREDNALCARSCGR